MELRAASRSAREWRTRFRALAPSRLNRLGWRGSDVGAALRDTLEAELGERAGFQWMAVAFGAGALIYFLLPREPLLAALLAGASLFGAAAARGYFRGTSWRLVAIVAVLLAGASSAKLRVDRLSGPQIERPTFAHLSARVVSRESRLELRPRIVLDSIRSDAFPDGTTPRRVRVTLAEKHGLPPLGSRIELNARLTPVSGAVVPGGYDAHRAAYFDGIGGGGFALGAWTLEADPPRLSLRFMVGWLRAAIVERIVSVEPGEAGAVASALLVGERSALSTETNDSLRVSGLFHILSISGLHMMLIGGTAFLAVRALLALSPTLALRYPIRKWAAVATLLVLGAYFSLSGGGAATVRAFVMAIILFGAVLVDRPAISMRNLAIAAFVVIALEPEGVLEPGFQMSFSAVAALIAAWEAWRRRPQQRLADDDLVPGFRFLRLLGRAVLGVALTTLVAGFATGIFAAYHFERVATYSLLGNLLAAPLVSLVIMPFGLLALVLMPFGLEPLPLAVMARGIDVLLAVAKFVASLPGAEAHAPQIAPASLLVAVAGLLWLCLWRRRWRLAGVPAIAAGLAAIPLLADPPDIMVAPEGRAVAVRDADGVLRVAGAKPGSYVVEQFFDEEGGAPDDKAVLGGGVRCDESACLLSGRGGLVVSHVIDPAAFAEDCRRAAIVTTALVAPDECGAALVIDAPSLALRGAHAVWFDDAGGGFVFRVTTDRTETPRPWQLPRP